MTDPTAGTGDPPAIGALFGHYRIDGVVGVGGMGMVYAATDLRLGRRVALKVVLGHYAQSPEFTRRFQREAAALARLDSPHVISIFDHGEHAGWPFIVTQYAAGGDLGRLLRQRGAMPPALAARLCAQLADALVAAHAVGVVHRDVKPANVLLRDERLDRLHVYLCDFGVALTEASGLTSPGAVAGTWNYLAPERAHGESGSPKSDLYSVGCLLWEAVTGRPPYSGTDVDVAMAHLSAPVPQLPGQDRFTAHANQILQRTMAKDPAARFGSAVELREELRELAGGPTGGTTVPTPSERRHRRPVVVAALLATAALVAAAAVLAVVAAHDDDPGSATTGPTTGSTSTASLPVDRPRPVSGDLDGDGLGDVGWSDFDRSYLELSDGRRLGDATRRQTPGPTVLEGDFDGDGALDLLRVAGTAPTLALTAVLPGTPRTTSVLQTPPERDDIDQDYMTADLDGDGLDDLVVSSPVKDRLTLTVALSEGDGRFSAGSTWLTADLRQDESGFAVGDFDSDGDDDLVHVFEGDSLADQPGLATMLRSDGRRLRPVGKPLRIPEQLDGDYFGLDHFSGGDVDGDGVPELVGFNPYGVDAVIWRWDETSFVGESLWASSYVDDTGGGGIDGRLSDVDGDGRDDLVTIGVDKVKVLLSTGTRLDYAPGWTQRVDFPDLYNLIDRVVLGIY